MSIIKPLKNTGEYVVNDINIYPSYVEIIIENEKYVINKNSYLNYYLYKGKAISLEELNSIMEDASNKQAIDYLNKILIKKIYSKSEIINKLKTKGYSYNQSEKIFEMIVSSGIYDSDLYLNEYISSCLYKGYSYSLISSNLLKEGYLLKEIDKAYKSHIDEKIDMNEYIFNICEKHKDYSLLKLKSKIFEKLKILGYTNTEITLLLEEFNKKYTKYLYELRLKEEEKIEKELKKAVLKYKNLTGYAFKSKCISYVLSKGFTYDTIINVYERSYK